jgi:pimeloyl-ACP methyl ester carboxylesterase
MSSSGDRRLPTAQLKILRLLLSRPKDGSDREAWVRHYIHLFQAIGSPGFPTPPDLLEARMRMFLERSHYPAGTLRQILAIIASGDRSAQLRRIGTPTLVLHGKDDPLVPVAHGVDCARKIPGAKLQLVAGMGHDLAPGLLPILQEHLLDHFVGVQRPQDEAHGH